MSIMGISKHTAPLFPTPATRTIPGQLENTFSISRLRELATDSVDTTSLVLPYSSITKLTLMELCRSGKSLAVGISNILVINHENSIVVHCNLSISSFVLPQMRA